MNGENKEEALTPEVLPKEALVILQETGVEKNTAEYLEKVFSEMFTEAKKWVAQADAIKVTDCSQVSEMQKARELRLTLKNIRCDVENKRKAMKADALAKGKAVDGIANVVKALIEPVESHLQMQEDFAKNVESARKHELFKSRLQMLAVYDPNVYESGGPDLSDMSHEMFDAMLNGMKMAKEQREEQARKEEEARIAEQKRIEEERAEQERQRQKELNEARARAEAEAEQRKKAEAERDEADRKAREQQRKADAELKATQEKLEAERKQAEKLRKEKEEAERIEREQRAEADRMERERILAELNAKQKAEQAPDKDKALAFAEHVKELKVPEMKSEAGKAFQKVLEEQMAKFSSWIVTAANAKL
jgi:hypothetical protein